MIAIPAPFKIGPLETRGDYVAIHTGSVCFGSFCRTRRARFGKRSTCRLQSANSSLNPIARMKLRSAAGAMLLLTHRPCSRTSTRYRAKLRRFLLTMSHRPTARPLALSIGPSTIHLARPRRSAPSMTPQGCRSPLPSAPLTRRPASSSKTSWVAVHRRQSRPARARHLRRPLRSP